MMSRRAKKASTASSLTRCLLGTSKEIDIFRSISESLRLLPNEPKSEGSLEETEGRPTRQNFYVTLLRWRRRAGLEVLKLHLPRQNPQYQRSL